MSAARKPTIPKDEVSRLVSIADRVWQYIGSDFMSGSDEFDNEAAVECCFDADRPLTCGHDVPQCARDQTFCKEMFAKYGFNTCVSSVASIVHYI